MPIKVEQINVNLFLDTYNSKNKKTGMNEMKMNDYDHECEMNNRARSIPEISVQRKPGEYRLWKK